MILTVLPVGVVDNETATSAVGWVVNENSWVVRAPTMAIASLMTGQT